VYLAEVSFARLLENGGVAMDNLRRSCHHRGPSQADAWAFPLHL